MHRRGLQDRRDRATGPKPSSRPRIRLLRYGRLATTAALLEATDILRQAIDRFFPQLFRDGAATPLRLIEALAEASKTAARRSWWKPTGSCGASGR